MTILSAAVLMFASCGDTKTTNTTNTAAVKNTAENKAATNTNAPDAANNAPTMSEAEMEKMMTEDIAGIDVSKPTPAGEFFDKFTANESEWKGKKIAVSGKYASYATSSSVINPSKSAWRFDLKGENDKKDGVTCVMKNEPKEKDEISKRTDFSKDVYLTVKGVARSTVEGMLRNRLVALEPCEIVKMGIK